MHTSLTCTRQDRDSSSGTGRRYPTSYMTGDMEGASCQPSPVFHTGTAFRYPFRKRLASDCATLIWRGKRRKQGFEEYVPMSQIA
jgi:hypothetical protein